MPKRKVRLISISSHSGSKTVTQRDLEDLILRRRELDEAHERWVAKREEIRAAIDAGAEVEPGVHSAALLHIENLRRLVVR